MKYVISRASTDKQPIKESRREKIFYKHIRYCTEKYFNEHFSAQEGLWRSKGTNHKNMNNGKFIQRDIETEVWVTDMDFFKIAEKYGELIYVPTSQQHQYYIPEIIIYDSYVE